MVLLLLLWLFSCPSSWDCGEKELTKRFNGYSIDHTKATGLLAYGGGLRTFQTAVLFILLRADTGRLIQPHIWTVLSALLGFNTKWLMVVKSNRPDRYTKMTYRLSASSRQIHHWPIYMVYNIAHDSCCLVGTA